MESPRDKKIKMIYTNSEIKVASWVCTKNNIPLYLTTTKDITYLFPNLTHYTSFNIRKLDNLLSTKKKITIMHDNSNRIYKLDNMVFIWNDTNIHKLTIISLEKGLIFNDNITVENIENIKNYYSKHGLYKILYDGSDIFVIIDKHTNFNIPLVY